jgi:type 1 glutamine amidotransferase
MRTMIHATLIVSLMAATAGTASFAQAPAKPAAAKPQVKKPLTPEELARRAAQLAKKLAEETPKVEAALPDKAPAVPQKARKLLVFNRAAGFVHDSIPLGAKTWELMGKKTGAFEATVTDDPAVFAPEKLQEFDAVMMNNTTGDCLPKPQQQKALLEFVKGGKGIAGVHSATDAMYKCPEYGAMMGGYFNGHPFHKIAVKLNDPANPINAAFAGKGFDFDDEIYTFRDPYSLTRLHVLLSVDVPNSPKVRETLNKLPTKHWKNRDDDDFAISWIRKYGNGRVFYCSLGHVHQTYWNPTILKQWLAGVQYVLGDLDADATPSAK